MVSLEASSLPVSMTTSVKSLKLPEGTEIDHERDTERAGIGRAELGLLQTALVASADRVAGELSGLLRRLGESVADGSDLQEIVQAIKALPELDPRFGQVEDVAVVLGRNDLHLLQNALQATSRRVVGELGNRLLQLGEHFASGSPELATIVRAIENLPMAGHHGESNLKTSSVGVNTSGTMVLPASKEDSPDHARAASAVQAELSRMRASLEAELKAAREEAERQRLRAEEALQRLDEDARKAESMITDLRNKLKALEALLQRAGLGKEAAAALSQAGLKDFITGRDVFERLYRDALRRMRVYAETQLRLLNRSAAAFIQTLHDLAAHPLGAVQAAMELQGSQADLSPLQVAGYAAADPRSNRSSPASSPKSMQKSRHPEHPEPSGQYLRRFNTANVEAHVARAGQQGRNAPPSRRGHPMRRAATEGSALSRGMPVRTLRQTLFEGLQDQQPAMPAQPHIEAHGKSMASRRQAQGPGDAGSDQEILASPPMLSIGGMGPRPAPPSQILPRPGTGSGQRSPTRLARSLPGQRPASSGGRGARRQGSGDESQANLPNPRRAHPSLQAQSRSFA